MSEQESSLEFQSVRSRDRGFLKSGYLTNIRSQRSADCVIACTSPSVRAIGAVGRSRFASKTGSTSSSENVGTENGAVCRIELDSPLIYLVLITQIDLLRLLYARILVPPAVLAELKHPVAPKPVQDWLLMRRIGWRS